MVNLKKYFSFQFLGFLIKGRSKFRVLALLILKIKYFFNKSGITVKNEEEIFKKFTKKDTFKQYVHELYDDRILSMHWKKESEKRKHRKHSNWSQRVFGSLSNVLVFYALIRELKPKVIVETGTASGSMTSFILCALNKNSKGKLISIDLLPQKNKRTMNFSLKRKDIGFWIPNKYKHRWKYINADAKTKLLEICSKQKVDYFIHDSLHTASHMLLEYSVARRFMSKNSVIASDDILWNNAFECFLKSQNLQGYVPINNPNLGIFLNSFDDFEMRNLT